ncbi:hypothetical protein TIFTF001_033455 [Ficus carica]|uniref:Uncharacterized protein n=1 Tax=Ficus carica TaxID=3494 RepID=A0AA88J979_FICCA|nr:hypothetical protein TIFTF001_033455 [Ficus carica]
MRELSKEDLNLPTLEALQENRGSQFVVANQRLPTWFLLSKDETGEHERLKRAPTFRESTSSDHVGESW